MRGVETRIQEIRHWIFREVARMAYHTEWPIDKRIEELPYKIIPGEVGNFRNDVFLERAIVGERLRLAMGLPCRGAGEHAPLSDNIEAADKPETYYTPPLINVIKFACNACTEKRVFVTDGCQGCLAHPCEEVCPKDAVKLNRTNGRARINDEKCIRCGKCADVCAYHAIIIQERPCAAACGVDAIHTDENGKKLEPMELAYVDVPEEFTGTVIDKLSQRKGELQNMGVSSGGYTRLEFLIPARGLIGYRGEFMTDTKGNGILNTSFNGYAPYKGDIQYRKQGSLIAFETGESVTYGLYSAQERGTLFIGPGEKVYAGMVIGQNGKAEDIELNVCKTKHLTNTRSSSADEALRLTPPRILSLEEALDFIDTDELLEVTPETLRIRKKILDSRMRKRSNLK